MNKKLYLYISRNFFVWFFGVLAFVSALIMLASLIELLRRTSGSHDVNLAILIRMACFQLPQILNFVMPFVYLSASILTVWFLNRSLQFVVARASGVSIWQILFPFICSVLLISAFDFLVVNPIGAAFSKRFDDLESRFIKRNYHKLSLSDQGLWLRQKSDDSYTIVHARKILDEDKKIFSDMSFFEFDLDDKFRARLDAKTGYLKDNKWLLENVTETRAGALTTSKDDLSIPTDFTFDKIQNSFAAPHTVSVWAMPSFVKVVENAGFSSKKHKLYWYSYLFKPLLYLAMIMISLPLALSLPRRAGGVRLILISVILGFSIYVFIDILFALGASDKIPVFVAASMPSLSSALLGLMLLLHVEKG